MGRSNDVRLFFRVMCIGFLVGGEKDLVKVSKLDRFRF